MEEFEVKEHTETKVFDLDEAAKKAYVAYEKANAIRSYFGELILEYESLPESIKKAWKEAAKALFLYYAE